MEKLYCPKCHKENKVRIINKDEDFEVRGDKLSINARIYVCNICNEEIFDEKLDGENMELLYSNYRVKHNLLIPSDIRTIRERYGLSQRAMARLLEWGEVTWNRYENGAIQDPVHNEVLELLKNPENMRAIFEKNKHLLSKKEIKILEEKLGKLITEGQKKLNILSIFEQYLTSDKSINEFTGFKPFDLQKTKNLILYIAEKSKGVMKTKANKLFFYIDFLFFKTYSVSLTGSKYVHLPFGPIPNDYDWIINLIVEEGLLEKNEVIFNKDAKIVGEELISKAPVNKDIFSEEELKVIDFCLKEFKEMNCTQISKYSHKEKPYKDTKDNEFISYKFAQELSLNPN